MSEQIHPNKTLMRRLYDELWNQGNPAVAQEIFARPEGVERFLTEFLAAFPDLQHTVIEIIAEYDTVVARFAAQGTHLGQWQQFAPTRKPIAYTGVTLARIAQGKIVEHVTWWDRAGLIEQISGMEGQSD